MNTNLIQVSEQSFNNFLVGLTLSHPESGTKSHPESTTYHLGVEDHTVVAREEDGNYFIDPTIKTRTMIITGNPKQPYPH